MVCFGPHFMSLCRQYTQLYQNSKFIQYYYLESKGENFDEFLDELTVAHNFTNKEEKMDWLKSYKQYIVHFELTENDLNSILEDKTVTDEFKTKFLVDFINQSHNIKRIIFNENFNLPIFNPQNDKNIGYITKKSITHLTFGENYNQQTKIPNSVKHL